MLRHHSISGVVVLAGVLALAGCNGGKKPGVRPGNEAANVAAPINAAAPSAPANGTSNAMTSGVSSVAVPAPSDIKKYLGKYPFDKVDGSSWRSNPGIIAAIDSIVSDPQVRGDVLHGDGPATPIRMAGGKLVSWACEAHNCNVHEWATLVDPANGAVQICEADEARTPGKSVWFSAAGREVRAIGCPAGEG